MTALQDDAGTHPVPPSTHRQCDLKLYDMDTCKLLRYFNGRATFSSGHSINYFQFHVDFFLYQIFLKIVLFAIFGVYIGLY